jgi:hypothetical protein
MDARFASQYGDFKRRNGMLSGSFTGKDTLPSMLAMGEMVLNPYQMQRVRQNAGFDVFKGAGIPNYAGGTYVAPPSQINFAGNNSSAQNQPIVIQVQVNNSGMVESDVTAEIINGLKKNPDVRVELVKAYDKEKKRTK